MGSINGFPVDVFVSTSKEYAADVPDDPIEDGSSLTDTIVNKPLMITVEGWVSDTPIASQVSDKGDLPTDDAVAALLAAYFAKEPISIEDSMQVYSSMAFTSLSIPRDADTGQALQFKATFKQITIVQNTRTTVPVATPSAQNKQNLGNKAAQSTELQNKLKALNDKVIDSVNYFPKDSLARRVTDAQNGGVPVRRGDVGTVAE